MPALRAQIPQVLFEIFPVVFMIPVMKSKAETAPSIYSCPVYKTSERRGVVSTTGHETNFVIFIPVPCLADEHHKSHWILRGVAMLMQLDE